MKKIFLMLIIPALLFSQSLYLNNNSVQLRQSIVDDIRLNLPDTLFCAVGIEMNVYFDNVILTNDYRDYIFKVVCDSGDHFSQRWAYTPSDGASGEFNFSLFVYNSEGDLCDADTIRVLVSPKISAGDNDILIFGDSLIDQQTLPHVVDSLTATYATYIGTRDTGGDSTANDGIGGTTWNYWENNVNSKFITDGHMDFRGYLTDNSLDDPDYVIICLGTNDCFAATEKTDSQIETALVYADSICNNIIADVPAVKIGILYLVPPSKEQDSFGDNYHSGYSRGIFKRSQHRYNEALKARYGANGSKKSAHISLIPTVVNLDAEHNMKTTSHVYNARNATTFARQSNGVHPAYDGYEQMADAIYGWLCAKW